MDSYMDRLSQKLTAQEMIKANSQADARELERLQKQVEEYQDCLNRMQQVNQSMQETSEKLTQNKIDLAGLNGLVEAVVSKMEELSEEKTKVDAMNQSMQQLFEQADEFVHRENVKVYRNVQAVVQQEAAKQSEALAGVVRQLNRKLTGILCAAILGMAVSIGAVVFLVLQYLHII